MNARDHFDEGIRRLGFFTGAADMHAARVAFRRATDLDPAMCDAWLGRLGAGAHRVAMLVTRQRTQESTEVRSPPPGATREDNHMTAPRVTRQENMSGRIGIWDADKFDRVVEIFTEAAYRLVDRYKDGLLPPGVVVKVRDRKVEW